jgi:hypothetical protein
MIRDNPTGAGNQQGSPPRADPSETTRRAPSIEECKAYVLGALHDGTYNRFHKTFRFSQTGKAWLRLLQSLLRRTDSKSWIYREGKNRTVFALETTASFLDIHFDPLLLKSSRERIAYVRGYFDAEGGMPHDSRAPLYIQICQKNLEELRKVRNFLEDIGIRCGVIHNPSKNIDPNYWRFYIRSMSHLDFFQTVSSWHPRKRKIISRRMMI